MMRFPSPLIAILLCSASLSACASDLTGVFSAKEKTAAAADASAAPLASPRTVASDLEAAVQQAQAQRLAGRYDDAIRTLSQLMLVASDDPRVVGEYGKTLAQKGRAQDAVQFLTRATELQQGDWTLYSALGVAYDQIGDQASAQLAYERALKLKPEDASVLNNYALSRMLAKDPEGAHRLIVRAEAAGGASDPKIARNIEMIDKLAANTPPQKTAAEEAPAPMPVAVSSHALPPVAAKTQPSAGEAKVVIQAVPADPLAGPVQPATHAPQTLQKPVVAAVKTGANPAAATDAVQAAAAVKMPAKPMAKVEAPVDLRPASAKSAKAAESKQGQKAKAPAKDGIPALRQTASAY